MTLGIYLHIPFCLSKCYYCDFVSFSDRKDEIPAYIECLKKEIQQTSARLKITNPIQTVYFGGGTPSSIPPQFIKDILSTLQDSFDLSHVLEITLEMNPETISDKDIIQKYRSIGINRISLGCQSFQDRILESMNRPHRSDKAIQVFQWLRESGFTNISLDLIFGYPGQSLEDWLKDLETAVSLAPEHLSFYGLSIEEGTPLWKSVQESKVTPTDEVMMVSMYQEGCSLVEKNGYPQYEISNFAKPDRESIHNSNYWKYGEYLGFGLNAHSFYQNIRSWNTNQLEQYIQSLQSDKDPVAGQEDISGLKAMSEYAMLSLRLKAGLDCLEFEKRFQRNPLKLFHTMIDQYQPYNLLKIEDNHIQLTRDGFLVSNTILSELFEIMDVDKI